MKLMKFLKKYLKQLYDNGYAQNKDELLNQLEENRNARILDIGCYDGSFSRRVGDKVGSNNVFGIELVKEHAAIAHKNNVNVVIANADGGLPFKESIFDIVVSNQVIEHLDNTDLFIREMHRVLRDDGICITSTMNLSSLHNLLSLILGYQPHSTHVSDEVVIGNPLNPEYKRELNPPRRQHRRIFTAKSIEELFEFHGLKSENLIGTYIYPLPLFISKWVSQTIARKYSVYITIKATRK